MTMLERSGWRDLAACALGLSLAACGVEVTTLGAVTSSAEDEDTGAAPDARRTDSSVDAAPDAAPDAFADTLPGRWTAVTTPADVDHLRGVWLSSPDEPWLLGIQHVPVGSFDAGPTDSTVSGGETGAPLHGEVVQRSGGGWRELELPVVAEALWGANPRDAWAVGTNMLEHTDGTTHTPYAIPAGWTEISAVWGADAGHVWAAGSTMLRWDGTSWSQQPLVGGYDRVRALWGSSDRDVWAVSEASLIRHWDGASWSAAPSGLGFSLRGVWGSGANDVWIVGDQGTLLHGNGATWRTVASGTTLDLQGCWGSGADDVWFVGRAGTILHWDGVALAPFSTPTTHDLSAVSGSSARSAWAAGDDTLLHFEK